MVWLAVLFLLPFYVVLSIAFGAVDPLFRTPVPVWNPVRGGTRSSSRHCTTASSARRVPRPGVLRTFLYVAAAGALCLVVACPSPTT